MTEPLLEVRDLHAFYGKSHILQGVNLSIGSSEVVSLLGRNGVGRSTTLKAIMGAVAMRGSVRFRGREIAGLQPHQVAQLGIGCVPENRDIFPTLTVRENLLLGQKSKPQTGRWQISDVFAMFPRLQERADVPGGVLSGGEQQLLSMCRTLMGNPDLIMIDEPTEGLAPIMVSLVSQLLEQVARRGISILLVEQKLAIALQISHRIYIMGHGQIVFEGTPKQFADDHTIRTRWLEV